MFVLSNYHAKCFNTRTPEKKTNWQLLSQSKSLSRQSFLCETISWNLLFFKKPSQVYCLDNFFLCRFSVFQMFCAHWRVKLIFYIIILSISSPVDSRQFVIVAKPIIQFIISIVQLSSLHFRSTNAIFVVLSMLVQKRKK